MIGNGHKELDTDFSLQAILRMRKNTNKQTKNNKNKKNKNKKNKNKKNKKNENIPVHYKKKKMH
jgi:hypothetical protein